MSFNPAQTEAVAADTSKKDPTVEVVGRVLVKGTYSLETVAHFGSGKSEGSDLSLVKSGDGGYFIPGSSLAGACRSYLAHYLLGAAAFGYTSPASDRPKSDKDFRNQEKDQQVDLTALFGAIGDDGSQSALIFGDAFAGTNSRASIRDGVRIDIHTNQAYQKPVENDQSPENNRPVGAKYDREVVEADTTFEIRLELVLRRSEKNKDKLKACLNLLLEAFEQSELRLGAKTSRGYGRGKVTDWQVQELDFKAGPKAVLDWLQRTGPTQSRFAWASTLFTKFESKLAYFELEAYFDFPNSLLVRSYQVGPYEVDAVHIKAGADARPVLPGTSVTGAIRHRAERIARTLLDSEAQKTSPYKATEVIDHLFGFVKEKERGRGKEKQKAVTEQQISRIVVEEEYLNQAELQPAIHTRVSIDRFTGGSLSGFLFEEEPLWPTASNADRQGWLFKCRIWHPENYEAGLLLLVLKDMWLGDLPVGGEVGIGRGVLKGLRTNLKWVKSDEPKEQQWQLVASSDESATGLQVEGGQPQALEEFVQKLITWLSP